MSQLHSPRDFPTATHTPRCFLARETEEWEDSAQRCSPHLGQHRNLISSYLLCGVRLGGNSNHRGKKGHGRGKATMSDLVPCTPGWSHLEPPGSGKEVVGGGSGTLPRSLNSSRDVNQGASRHSVWVKELIAGIAAAGVCLNGRVCGQHLGQNSNPSIDQSSSVLKALETWMGWYLLLRNQAETQFPSSVMWESQSVPAS